METTWRVMRVNLGSNQVMAELTRVEWFKANPAWLEQNAAVDAMAEEQGEEAVLAHPWEDIPEYLEATPGEQEASYVPVGPSIWVDVTDWEDAEIKPEQNIKMKLELL